MVDAIDLRFTEDLADLAVEALRGFQVVPERLLDDDPSPAAVVKLVIQPGPPELGHDRGELRGLGGQVVEVVAAGPVFLVDLFQTRGQRVEALGIVEVESLVRDPLGERAPGVLIERLDAAELLERRPDLGPERLVVERPPTDGQQHELVRQQVGPPQLVESRDDLAMGEIACRPEQHQDRWVGDALEAKALAQDVGDRLRA